MLTGVAERRGSVQTRASRDSMIEGNLGTARLVARVTAMRYGVEHRYEEVESAALAALVSAADRFDPGAGTSFRTYAIARMVGATVDELRAHLVLPGSAARELNRIRRFCEQNGCHVGWAAAAERAGVGARRGWALANWAGSVVSIGPREDGEPGYELPDDSPPPDRVLELREFMDRFLCSLRPQELAVFNLCYYEGLTMREVGLVLGLGRTRVYKLLKNVRQKARRLL